MGVNLASGFTFKVLEPKKTHPKVLYSFTSMTKLMGVLGSWAQRSKAGESKKEEQTV